MRELDRIRHALIAAADAGEPALLATVMRVDGSVYRGAGARMVVRQDGATIGGVSGGCLEADIIERAPGLFLGGNAELVRYDTRVSDDVVLGLGLGCQGVIDVLLEALYGDTLRAAIALNKEISTHRTEVTIVTLVRERDGYRVGTHAVLDANGEFVAGDKGILAMEGDLAREEIKPATSLVICGGGNDAIPLAQLAKSMGWHVTVVDHRPAFATRSRFPEADVMVCANITDADVSLADHVPLDRRTMAISMAHSATFDRAYVRALLEAEVGYIGVLGPRRRTLELLGTPSVPANVYSPIGLDTGAETPEEIALSIVAEIAAVSAGREGGHLRNRDGPIHDR